MPSLRSLVIRRATPMDMGAATSSVTTVSTPAKNGVGQKKVDKANKLTGIRLPLLRKEPSVTNLSPPERTVASKGAEAPLLRPESSASLEARSGGSWLNLGPGALRRCETAVGLSTLTLEGRPVNRSRVCSRCSSLLSLASSSRYSLAAGSFVPAVQQSAGRFLCKLCLSDVSISDTFKIESCGCSYCKDCMRSYVEFEIEEGAYDISCPDAQCEDAGVLSLKEITSLVTPELMEKHQKFRLNRDVSMDKGRAWCPRAGCETICSVNGHGRSGGTLGPVHCPTCSTDFCSICREPWHGGGPCSDLPLGIPFDSDYIKCCPMCSVPIEKDEGCAQMMCKRCKHVFCWYCLASLDDDFLLRHYDKGPCKNKLGHSRASVIWHRTQVIGIFAGFGLLLLVASPLLLLAAPCIVCCKCRMCGSSRLDQEEGPHEDAPS
ncbi:probable E3 ubiquitin-protein ligase RNF144A [Orussus abietinus]|uniref:probable E3 ubiquitin-protein ligase RNF144A n=1 Tax=Orussus abietinus TaxID=222816 RepID=UPI00062636B9|nr:probable E3 ubiquitin-protein ligase RNF144A [Orussus abietinus]